MKRASLKPAGGSWDKFLFSILRCLSHSIKCFMKWDFHQQKCWSRNVETRWLVRIDVEATIFLSKTLDLVTSALFICWYSSWSEVKEHDVIRAKNYILKTLISLKCALLLVISKVYFKLLQYLWKDLIQKGNLHF